MRRWSILPLLLCGCAGDLAASDAAPDVHVGPEAWPALPDSPPLCDAAADAGSSDTTCAIPTDPCKAVASCPTDHGCIPLLSAPGSAACLPAAGAGQACSTSVFCAVNHVCGSVNGGSFTCLPTCATKGAACGTGGTCLDWQGCLFCSSPS